jgi:membrane protease YdiL (CAAX protease family)
MSGQDFRGVKFKVIFLLLLAAFIAPYSIGWNWGWWKFMPSTLVIIGCARLVWPGSWRTYLGLRAKPGDFWFAVLIFSVVYVVGGWLIGRILGRQGFVPGPVSENLGWRYLAVFQALNEEMVLRALLLTWLSLHVSKQIVLCMVVAAVFALAHGVYYGLVAGEAVLSTAALLSLFLFGLAGNLIFLESGSIAGSYAIHVAWNINRFGLDWTAAATGLPMPEGLGFSLVEGNALALGLALILVLATWGWSQSRRKLEG